MRAMSTKPFSSRYSSTTRLGSHTAARTVRRLWWRFRYLFAAGLFGLSMLLVLAQFTPSIAAEQAVVVAARDIPAGTKLTAAHLTIAAVPMGARPEAAIADPASVIGRTTLVPVPAGIPIFSGVYSGGDLVAQAPPGTVVVPIKLESSAAELLRPGDHIDVLTTAVGTGQGWANPDDGPTEPRSLARRALVLPDGGRLGDGGGSGLLSSVSSSGTQLTLVAVAAQEAPQLTAQSLSGSLVAVLVP